MSPVLLLVLGIVIALGSWVWSLRAVDGSNAIAICVVLASCAVAFNVIVPIPNVEATTTIVVCCAIVLGARLGATVAMLAVLGTGVTGGFGPWTTWQVAATVLIAVLAALLGPVHRRIERDGLADRILLVAMTVCAVLAYDVLVTAATLQSISAAGSLVGTLLLGLPYTLVHVAASALFTLLAGPALVFALGRARHRISAPSVHAEQARG